MHTALKYFTKITVASLLLVNTSFAIDYTCSSTEKVLVKTKKKYKLQRVELTGLNCNKSFETKNFKIVFQKDNTALKINKELNESLRGRAANTLYHLEKAKNYWVTTVQSNFVESMPQMTIRLDIKNSYSKYAHFNNNKKHYHFNNAYTTPAGKTPSFVKDQAEWGQEIWLRPMRRLLTKDLLQTKGGNPLHQALTTVEAPVKRYVQSKFRFEVIDRVFRPGNKSSSLLKIALNSVGTLAIIEITKMITRQLDGLFLEKYYYLDPAMMPEVLYHEFAHAALSDYIEPTHSEAIIEGYADYFAMNVSNSFSIYNKIEGYSTVMNKSAKNKKLYNNRAELAGAANSDFVLSVIYNAKKRFNELNKKRAKHELKPIVNFDELVFQSRTEVHKLIKMRNNSSRTILGIREILTHGLVEQCKKTCSNIRVGVNLLNKTFEDKGI